MPDNFKITDFIFPKDNTAVYLGSPELPRYTKQYYPDYNKGKEEYNKGNYLDKDAKAYAEKISGKTETVSPEFDLVGFLGLNKGLKWLLMKPTPTITSTKLSATSTNSNLKDNPFKFYYGRLKDGSYKNVGGTKFPLKELQEDLMPFDISDPKQLQIVSDRLKVSKKEVLDHYNKNPGIQLLHTEKYIEDRLPTIIYNSQVKQEVDALPYAINHEFNHILHFVYGNYSAKMKPDFILPLDEFINEMRKIKPDKSISELVNDYKYFTEKGYTELSSRGTQIKDFLKISDNSTPITEEGYKKALKEYPKIQDNLMTEFFVLMGKDYRKAAEYLTKTSSGVVPVILYNKNDN